MVALYIIVEDHNIPQSLQDINKGISYGEGDMALYLKLIESILMNDDHFNSPNESSNFSNNMFC